MVWQTAYATRVDAVLPVFSISQCQICPPVPAGTLATIRSAPIALPVP
jgi:hypothetical protein